MRNPEEAARDKAKREKIVKKLEEQLPHIKTHAKAVCELMAHPVYGRYLKLDSRSLPKIDRAKIREEEKLDGNTCCAPRTTPSPPKMSPWATSNCCW